MPLKAAKDLAEPTVLIGDAAPAFILKDANGVDTSFADIKQKKPYIALVFLRSVDWCRYCIFQLNQFQKNLERLRDAGIEPVVVSHDAQEVIKEASDKFNITYTLLSDPDSELIKAYGVLDERTEKDSEHYGIAYPITFVIEQTGKVVSILPGSIERRHNVDDLLRATPPTP